MHNLCTSVFNNIVTLILEGKMKAQQIIIGNIITMDEDMPRAEALAAADGRIIYIGTEEGAMALADDDTEVQVYKDKTIYPGFIEAHCHPLLAGSRFNMQADMTSGKSLQDYVEIMTQWIDDHPGRTIYQGAGWKLEGFEPHKSILDEICPDVPMVLNSFDGHSVWLNSAAVEAFEFNQSKVEEFGTDLVRVDENGDITGYISEKPAIDLAGLMLKFLTPELLMENMMAWQNFAFSQGITACHDAGTKEDGVKLMAAMIDKGMYKLRTCMDLMLDEQKDKDMQAIVDKADELAKTYNSEYAKVKGIKIFVDGVVEAHTGWLLDDYCDKPGYNGIQRFCNPEDMKNLIMAAAEKNLFVHSHCIGDAATKCVVDGVEAARKEDGRFEQRNLIAHLQIIRDEDIKRMAELNVAALVAPLWVPKTLEPAVDKNEILYLGMDRFENEYPIKSFIDKGGLIAFHSDFPVSAVISVPRSVYMAVARTNPDNPEEGLRGASERITRMESLKAMTVNAAITIGEEDNLGSLKVGKVANMAVYDCDFLEDDLDKVLNAQLAATIVDGKVVYASEN